MPAGDVLDEVIVGAELKVSAVDAKKDSIALARDVDASHDGTTSIVGRRPPTTEELETLRKVSFKIPFSILTIAFIELCERFSYYGAIVVCKPSTPQQDMVWSLRSQ